MISLVHSELTRLRTLRSTAWAAAALLVITLLTAGFGLGGLIAEKIVGGYLGDAGQFLPYALIENVLGLNTPLAFGSAVLALAGLTAALGLVAQRLVVPRDVT